MRSVVPRRRPQPTMLVFTPDGRKLLVPGRGRICDVADLVFYRNMVTEVRGDPFAGYEKTTTRRPLSSVKLLVPVVIHAQSSIECALQLHPLVKDRVGDIVEIRVATHQITMQKIVKSGPQNMSLDGVVQDPDGAEGFRLGGWFVAGPTLSGSAAASAFLAAPAKRRSRRTAATSTSGSSASSAISNPPRRRADCTATSVPRCRGR